jgi:FixJ family two-component response regulator
LRTCVEDSDIPASSGCLAGRQVSERLLAEHLALKVIYSSGYSADAIANGHTLKKGVNFLSKPFTPDRLLATVQNALAAKASPLELVPAGAGS